MGVDPNDLDSIKQSNEQAIPKGRDRQDERFTDVEQFNKAKYPLRKVTEHVGGHTVTVDSTPGYRIVETAHGSGTHQTWTEDGAEYKMVVGNQHQYVKEGYTLTVDQNGDIRIEGHARLIIGGGAHIEVDGDVSLVATGSMSQHINGNYKTVVLGNMVTSVAGTMSMISQGDQLTKTGANFTTNAAGNYKMNSGGTSTMESGGGMTKKAPKIDLNP